MRKERIISFLAISALFLCLFTSCGIPQMFPWSDDVNYDITSSSINFRLRFRTTGSGEEKSWTLVPSPDTPILRFYYLIVPEASMQSTVSGVASSFGSRYSSSFPKSFGRGEKAYTSSYETYNTDDETISVSLYELSVIHSNGRFEPVSSYFQGLDWFEPVLAEGEEQTGSYADEYTATFSFRQEDVENSNEYYIILTLNGQDYRLGRSNGMPFIRSLDTYYDDDYSEFLPEDSDGLQTDARLLIYATASFAFEDYTTRRTITIDRTRTSYDQPLI